MIQGKFRMIEIKQFFDRTIRVSWAVLSLISPINSYHHESKKWYKIGFLFYVKTCTSTGTAAKMNRQGRPYGIFLSLHSQLAIARDLIYVVLDEFCPALTRFSKDRVRLNFIIATSNDIIGFLNGLITRHHAFSQIIKERHLNWMQLLKL